jgi:hypothetical protein
MSWHRSQGTQRWLWSSVQRDRGRPAVRVALSPRVDLWPLAIDEEFWRKKEETERFLDPFADSRLTDLLTRTFSCVIDWLSWAGSCAWRNASATSIGAVPVSCVTPRPSHSGPLSLLRARERRAPARTVRAMSRRERYDFLCTTSEQVIDGLELPLREDDSFDRRT